MFIFYEKKHIFKRFFRNGQRSVAEPGPTPSPWSIFSISNHAFFSGAPFTLP